MEHKSGQSFAGATKTTLDNGLTVVLKEIHTAPVATSWVWYRVGSRNEPTGLTGVSHWVEHMLFKGTEKFPAGSMEKLIPSNGGVWNAFTWVDFTAYYETLPADRIGLALQIEADRMRNTIFDPDEVASERTVIISERQGAENSPLFQLSEELQAAAFRVHPYHHEVIGDQVDLENMTRDDLYRHYQTFYVPNNAILVLVGSFDAQAMLAQITELFGGIPAGETPPAFARAEPPQRGERRVALNGPGQTDYLMMAHHTPQATSADFFPMLVLDSVLSGASSLNMFGGGISNKTSRLYQKLVLGELAAGISGGVSATIDPYLYTIVTVARPGIELAQIEQVLNDELARICEQPISQTELDKAIKQARALFAYGAESVTNQGFWLGFSEILDTYDWVSRYLERLNHVTIEDVQRVARQVLAPANRTVGHYRYDRPNGTGPGAAHG